MKVFACYSDEDEIEYRWNTILQFGESWEVIGTVIMKNPGSANPLQTEISDSVQELLNGFDASDKWYEFTDDSTLRWVGKLFEESLGRELNGVIRVFNLFNVKDQDLGKALDKLAKNKALKCFTVDNDVKHLCNPIYIGWGDLWKDKNLKSIAQKYFNAATELNSQEWYLSHKIEDKNNKYSHPQWLMGQGVHSLSSLLHRAKFRVNRTVLSKIELCEVKEILKSYPKTHENAIKAIERMIDNA